MENFIELQNELIALEYVVCKLTSIIQGLNVSKCTYIFQYSSYK